MEHLHHFGLSDDPFRNEPVLSRYLPTQQHSDALRRLERGVRQTRGLSMLIGEAGAGKTMLVHQLLETLEDEVFESGILVVSSELADADWMLRRIAVQLGVREPEADRDAILEQVYDHLAIVREDGRHAVLIIDDAEALIPTRALAEIASLLNLEYENRRLLSLVLSGDVTLDAAISGNAALAHRVDVKVRLDGLDAAATADYLAHRLIGAAGDPSLIQPGALESLHTLGRGLPGRMNTLADNALFEAFLCRRVRMESTDVERAFADLQPYAIEAACDPVATARPPLARIVQPETPHEFSAEASIHDSPLDLDREFEAVFESATVLDDDPLVSDRAGGVFDIPVEGPPKEAEEEVEDLLVEIIDD